MELVNLLIDSNIALYYLAGDKKLSGLLDNVVIHVSFITELELLSYPDVETKERKEVEKFIDDCVIIDINHHIKKEAIAIWNESNLKLPDSIIAGTAISEQLAFLSADKDFKQVNDLYLYSYEV